MKEFSKKVKKLHTTVNEKLDAGLGFVFNPLVKFSGILKQLPFNNRINNLIWTFLATAGAIAFIKFKEAPLYALYPIYFFALWPIIFAILQLFFLSLRGLIIVAIASVLNFTLGWFHKPKELLTTTLKILIIVSIAYTIYEFFDLVGLGVFAFICLMVLRG